MNNVNPFFSIIIPVYNSEKYLEDCIKSVISQTYSNWEAILVDDGSNDGSRKIIDLFAKEYENIRAYHKSNSGQSDSRKFGAAHSRGKYLIFLDSDDKILDNALETIMHYLINYDFPQCLIYGLRRGDFYNEKWEIWSSENECMMREKKEMLNIILSSPQYNSLCRKAIKKEVFCTQAMSESSMRYGEDLFQTLKIIEKLDNLLIIPQVLYSYRQNPNSITHCIDYQRELLDLIKVKEYSLQMVKKYSAFNEKDYRLQSKNYLVDFIDVARGISFVYDSLKRNELLDLMLQSNVYRCFIRSFPYRYSDVGPKIIFYRLLNARRFETIALLERIYQRVHCS